MKPFSLPPAKLRSWLIATLLVIGVMHLVMVGGSYLFGWPRDSVWVSLFNVDNEYNVPTFYSSLLLAAIGAVALKLRTDGPYEQRYAWLAVALLFFYMAADEILVLHERMSEPVRELLELGNDSLFYHAWTVPAIIISLLVVFSIYRLSHALPKMWRLHFVELLVLYAIGVIAFEMIGTMLFGNQALYYSAVVLGEESFELALQSVILYTMYQHLPARSLKPA